MPVIVTRGGASIKALGFAGAGKPLAPTIGTNTRSSGQINVNFTPGYNGGAPISTYTATSTPGNIIFTGQSSPIAATGLTLGTAYTFTVYATNVYGDSPLSDPSNSLTFATVPPPPTIGTATIVSATSVTVSYTAPATDGSSPITSYTAISTPGGITGTINQAGSGTITVSGLTSGTEYSFNVYATNALGNGAGSASSNTVTPDLPTYTISSNLLAMVGTELVDEGTTASFYIDTNATVSATTLYWSVSGTGITVGDFVSGSLTGNVSITPTVRSTVSLAIRADGTTEGSETFTLRFYTDSSRTILLSDVAISGYVIGNSRPVQITDTSTVSYTITRDASSVNEGSSIGFSLTSSNSNTVILYWQVQTLSGTVNSSDLTTSGSATVSGGSGAFSISISADQVTEGAESFRILLYSDSGYNTLVAISGSVTINDTSVYPAAGTQLNQYCLNYGVSPYTLRTVRADGSGGSYNDDVNNSPTCGYVPPTIGASATVYFPYVINGPNTDTKGYYVYITKGTPGPATQYWSLTGNYPPINTAGAGYGNHSGIFASTTSTAVVVFFAPHTARYFTVTVSGDGYTSFQQLMYLGDNPFYSPFTVYAGYLQEMAAAGITVVMSYAQQVVNFYRGNGTFYVTHDPGVIRYQVWRSPEIGGVTFWAQYMANNGISSTSDQRFLDAFGSAPETFTPKTSFNPGTGYGEFYDRP